jgi:hypothetical protein
VRPSIEADFSNEVPTIRSACDVNKPATSKYAVIFVAEELLSQPLSARPNINEPIIIFLI